MVMCRPGRLADYRRAAATSLIALIAWLACGPYAAAQTPTFESQAEARTVALTNELRAQHGLAPLAVETRLADAARYFAGYIAAADRLDHDADGSTPPERVKQRGYNYCMVAENLASEFDSRGFTVEVLSRNFVKGWSESPTHRSNMLDADVTQIGVGVARAKSGEYYAVQVFGRPRTDMVKFRIANRTGATVRYDYRKRTTALSPKQTRTHESCTPGEIRLDAAGQIVTLRPKDGARYAVVEAGRNTFRIAEEP